MDAIPLDKLERMFEEAHKLVPPCTRWLHYKGMECTAWRLAVIEDTEEIGVVYSTLLYPEMSFVCPLSAWQETMQLNSGRKAPRFTRI
ncbi:DUF1653 domain-containing protein [Candidatus Saccharibacteria bacterium]|nr:MAG: DUF1653 domain-containing protein [Candidatus Saccharibacteria bacterium]